MSSDFTGKIAIYALTSHGAEIAKKLAEKLEKSVVFHEKGRFKEFLHENWSKFDAHILIMATGIVVRQIAPLLEHKTVDPAVIVCDEKGQFAISLLSGHIGGANRLTRMVADALGGQAVITTATDVQNLVAFDEMAAIMKWRVANPECIKVLNSMLLEGKTIAVSIPIDVFERFYAGSRNVIYFEPGKSRDFAGVVVLRDYLTMSVRGCPVLWLEKTES